MTQNRILRLLALAILCVLPACPAIVAYADLADWLAVATQSGATVDFDTFTPQDTNLPSIGPLSGMTFTAPGDTVRVPNLWGDSPWGTGTYLMTTQSGFDLRVDFTEAITAFAALMMIDNSQNTSTMTVKVNGVSGELFSEARPTLAKPTPTFFGIVSDSPGVTFTSITFTPATNLARLDDVRLGAYNDPTPDPDPMPEPGTGFLVFGGATLIALDWLRKRC